MILLTSLLSMRLRSLATEALYSILYAKALSQLGAGDDGIVLIPKPLQSNLVVRILGQIGLQCLTDQKGLGRSAVFCRSSRALAISSGSLTEIETDIAISFDVMRSYYMYIMRPFVCQVKRWLFAGGRGRRGARATHGAADLLQQALRGQCMV